MTGSQSFFFSILTIFLQLLLLSSIAVSTVSAQECAADGAVCDTHLLCPVWKKEGKCKKDVEHMKKHCPASCYVPIPLTQTPEQLIVQTTQYGVLQEAIGDKKEQTMEVIARSSEYVKNLTELIRITKCSNKHEYCSFWAADGTSFVCWKIVWRSDGLLALTNDCECERNSAWMKKNCGPACGNCHKFQVSRKK